MNDQVRSDHKPKLSIIVPVLNGREYILDSLESLTKVEESISCEIIFQNSCSTDGTTDILDTFCSHGKRRYHINEQDSGQSNAINAGMNRANGDWVTWLCADDMLLPGVAGALRQAEEVSASVCYGDVLFIHNGSVFPAIGTERHTEGVLAKKRLVIQQPGTCILRKVWQEMGGVKENLNWSMDYDIFLRMESLGKIFYRATLFVAVIRVHRQAKTSSGSSRRLWELWSILHQSHRRRPSYFRIRPYLVYGIEYIIKYLEAAQPTASKRLVRIVLGVLHRIFWVVASARERGAIVERFNALDTGTAKYAERLALKSGN